MQLSHNIEPIKRTSKTNGGLMPIALCKNEQHEREHVGYKLKESCNLMKSRKKGGNDGMVAVLILNCTRSLAKELQRFA